MKLGIEELSIIVEGLRLRVKQLSSSVTEINQSIENLETEDGTKAPAIMQTTSPAGIASFSDGAEDMPIKSLKCTIVPVQAGTGDPAPDNIRPITGLDGVTVTRTGKNLFGGLTLADTIVDAVSDSSSASKSSDSDGNYVALTAGPAISNKIIFENFKPNTQYTFIFKFKKSNTNPNLNLQILYTNGTTDAVKYSTDVASDTLYTIAITSTAGKSVKAIKTSYYSGTAKLYYDSCGVFEGVLTESDFKPYTGDSHSLTFPQTVYGGWVDVIKGELHITHGHIASYAGETLPGEWISDRDVYAEGTTPTTGAQVVYDLAQEIVLQLEPVTITTLSGINNIYCNTGSVAVVYAADTKIYIDNAIAALTPEEEEEEEAEPAPEEEEEEEAEPAPEEDTAEPEEAAEVEEIAPVVKRATRKK